MKLVTFTKDGSTRTGAVVGDGVVDLQAADGSIPKSMIDLLWAGDAAMSAARKAVAERPTSASGRADVIRLADVTIEAPIARPGKVLAIGLNYRDHAEESGQEIPKKPVVFAKVSTCITGPGKPVHMPKVSRALDYEAELCFVIGKKGRHISQDDALDYVAGYMCGNDVSVRDWQFHSPTWMMGKGFDTHGPIGPWLVTPDEADGSSLDIRLFLNDEEKQHSNTSQLIFGIPELIEYLSDAFTLEPGDVVFTGTPAGVGAGSRPPSFVKAGDVMRVEIEGLGVLENAVVEEPAG